MKVIAEAYICVTSCTELTQGNVPPVLEPHPNVLLMKILRFNIYFSFITIKKLSESSNGNGCGAVERQML